MSSSTLDYLFKSLAEPEEKKDTSDDEEVDIEDSKEPDVKKVDVTQQLITAIRSKLIIFDGHYRDKEIDIFFSAAPNPDIVSKISYQRILPNGEIYVADTN